MRDGAAGCARGGAYDRFGGTAEGWFCMMGCAAAARIAVVIVSATLLVGCDRSDTSADAKRVIFGPGRKIVGKDIAPGLYRADGSPDCSYERLRGLEDTEANVIIDKDITGPTIVRVEKSDKVFESGNCGNWRPITTRAVSRLVVHDGETTVGDDMPYGDYYAPGGKGCHWERVQETTPGNEEVVGNGDPPGAAFAIIQYGDTKFRTNNCGTWHHIE